MRRLRIDSPLYFEKLKKEIKKEREKGEGRGGGKRKNPPNTCDSLKRTKEVIEHQFRLSTLRDIFISTKIASPYRVDSLQFTAKNKGIG